MSEPQEALYLTTSSADPEPKWRTKAEVDAILLTPEEVIIRAIRLFCEPFVQYRKVAVDSAGNIVWDRAAPENRE